MGGPMRLYDPRARRIAVLAGGVLVLGALGTIYVHRGAFEGTKMAHEGAFAVMAVVPLLLGIGCALRLRRALLWARGWTTVFSVGIAVGFVLAMAGCERAKGMVDDVSPVVPLSFAAWHAVAWLFVVAALRAEAGDPAPPPPPPAAG